MHLRTDLRHFSCYCMIILISSKWLYTTWCSQQCMYCACQKCMFINACISGSISKAFRSCKVLQLISFSDQQQTTKGVICTLWALLIIFVEKVHPISAAAAGESNEICLFTVLDCLSLDFPNGAFLTHRCSLCDLLRLTHDYIFLI